MLKPVFRLFQPVDIASLVYSRVVFGAIMLWQAWRYFQNDWIAYYYIEPAFHFTYYGFDWVQPWPENGMYWHFFVIAVLAVCIMLGFCYRFVTVLHFLAISYVFLLDQALYLNHAYLVCLISLLMIFIPAHRNLSIDALLRPGIRSDTAPAWALWILRVQIGLVYFFAGIAKLNGDWLMGEPMRMWLADRTDYPLVGSLFTQEWVAYAFTYGGLLFDLTFFPLVLWRRTRPYALVTAVIFHLTNWYLFDIGIFPWMMLAANMLFLHPGWPRRIINGFWQGQSAQPISRSRQRLTLALISAYMVYQIAMPLRHFLYPGDVNWTEQGHRFSWHMKLRDKNADVQFFVTDPATSTTWEIDPARYLTSRQRDEMSTRPDMILQFSHYIRDLMLQEVEEGYERVEVRAHVMASLNGRVPQLLIDPTIDLATQDDNWQHWNWLVPLSEPLRPGSESTP